jgi:hypothetical protein
MADDKERDDSPIGMVDGELIEASDDYDDDLLDAGDDEEPEAETEKTADRAPPRRLPRIIIHRS